MMLFLIALILAFPTSTEQLVVRQARIARELAEIGLEVTQPDETIRTAHWRLPEHTVPVTGFWFEQRMFIEVPEDFRLPALAALLENECRVLLPGSASQVAFRVASFDSLGRTSEFCEWTQYDEEE